MVHGWFTTFVLTYFYPCFALTDGYDLTSRNDLPIFRVKRALIFLINYWKMTLYKPKALYKGFMEGKCYSRICMNRSTIQKCVWQDALDACRNFLHMVFVFARDQSRFLWNSAHVFFLSKTQISQNFYTRAFNVNVRL